MLQGIQRTEDRDGTQSPKSKIITGGDWTKEVVCDKKVSQVKHLEAAECVKLSMQYIRKLGEVQFSNMTFMNLSQHYNT